MNKELLEEYLEYNPDTGVFIHIKKIKHARRKVGDIAGHINNNGYVRVTLFGIEYMLHRVAWLFMTGEQPNVVDHENRVRDDNRFENLRDGSTRDNSKNMKFDKRNTTGVKGVHFNKKDKIYIVFLGKNYIGCFKNKQDAIDCRVKAATKDGYLGAQHECRTQNTSN